ncbi:MAG: DUF4399 domain-containing protein [Deltaproteobacteria bacterium]|nr:MAG: DUF4399 domain-containing protein [Deltaproteobacteria bacterium]
MRSAIVLILALTACGGSEPAEKPAEPAAEEKAPEPAPEKAAIAADAPEALAVPEGARVFFVEPADGATVKSPVKVKMGVEGMEVKPAGEIVPATGHHHILVDADGIATGGVVPKDAQHIHYGDGSTETELELTPGEHSLKLQFANGSHMSYGEAMSATITVTVEE